MKKRKSVGKKKKKRQRSQYLVQEGSWKPPTMGEEKGWGDPARMLVNANVASGQSQGSLKEKGNKKSPSGGGEEKKIVRYWGGKRIWHSLCPVRNKEKREQSVRPKKLGVNSNNFEK